MATTTTNLALIKPAGTDKIRIAQINSNMDTIDAKIGPVGSTNLQSQVNTKLDKSGDAMTGNLTIKKSQPTIFYQDGSDLVGEIASSSSNNRMYFAEWASGSNGKEGYMLPTPESHSSATWYSILTSKTAVTVAQGGTGATTAAGARTNLGLSYTAGDTYTINNNRVCAPGVVASSGKSIYVSINTPKSLENISSISVTALSGSISGINGQIANSGGSFDWLSQSGVTVSALKSADNVVRITISKSTAFSNASTTQTPVVGLLSMTLSFS